MMTRWLTVVLAPLVFTSWAAAQDDYKLGPDSMEQADVPHGKVTKATWKSKIFPGTVRDYWVYVPAQYDGQTPACVMVFQDGGGYVNDKGQFRVPIVFDNLIHKKEMPVTIGIFINPGAFPPREPATRTAAATAASSTTRSPTSTSASWRRKSCPRSPRTYKLRQDAAGRAICGISSGGICAFTVAWERPDLFSKVLSHVGSFTNIRGGDVYPGLIRKTEHEADPRLPAGRLATTWTTCTATGRWRTRRWPRR